MQEYGEDTSIEYDVASIHDDKMDIAGWRHFGKLIKASTKLEELSFESQSSARAPKQLYAFRPFSRS